MRKQFLQSFDVLIIDVFHSPPAKPALGLLPGGAATREAMKAVKAADPRRLKHVEAIVLSMTPEERQHPELLSGSRRARVAKGWTEKQLALEIMERELLIKKVEKGDLIPEEELRKKLEKVLGISLIESVEKEVKSPKGKGMTTTLGDIISIRK